MKRTRLVIMLLTVTLLLTACQNPRQNPFASTTSTWDAASWDIATWE